MNLAGLASTSDLSLEVTWARNTDLEAAWYSFSYESHLAGSKGGEELASNPPSSKRSTCVKQCVKEKKKKSMRRKKDR